MQSFTRTTNFSCSPEELYRWHSREGALERLLPPWEKTTVLRKKGTIQPGSMVELKMHFGPVPFIYRARHTRDIPEKYFEDIQEKGPFRSWQHGHSFLKSEEGATLLDEIHYGLPFEKLLPSKIKESVERQLETSFLHREKILQHDMAVHGKYSKKPLRILISGASGVIGRQLVPFLTTGGHEVWTLVRRKPRPDRREIFWDPGRMILDPASLPEIDAVIHLAGKYIGLGRWSEKRKKSTLESRIKGTSLLAGAIASLPRPPKVFLSSSATGYYGDCGETEVSESSNCGKGYLPLVCSEWEKCSKQAQRKGIRTVQMRIGMVLSAQGGALKQLREAPIGYVKQFGSGNQWFSWISINDLLASFLHCIHAPDIEGPINLVSPRPVTNKEMNITMAKITEKPVLPGVPETIISFLYGEMADELLLASCRVSSKKLVQSGFTFSCVDLEQAIRDQLGLYRNCL